MRVRRAREARSDAGRAIAHSERQIVSFSCSFPFLQFDAASSITTLQVWGGPRVDDFGAAAQRRRSLGTARRVGANADRGEEFLGVFDWADAARFLLLPREASRRRFSTIAARYFDVDVDVVPSGAKEFGLGRLRLNSVVDGRLRLGIVLGAAGSFWFGLREQDEQDEDEAEAIAEREADEAVAAAERELAEELAREEQSD